MIKSFTHKGLHKFFESGVTAGIQPKHAVRLANILALLDRALHPHDMALPGYDLHPLKGNKKGLWAANYSRLKREFE